MFSHQKINAINHAEGIYIEGQPALLDLGAGKGTDIALKGD